MIAASIAFVLACAGAWLVRLRAARWGLVNLPNARSSHERPTPRGGGIGIVLGGMLAGLWLIAADGWADAWPLLVLSLLAAGVGLWDDIRPLPPAPRLVVLFALCGALLLTMDELPRLEVSNWLVVEGALLAFLALMAGVWWINLFNFMDGTDGIAGAQASFMLLAAAGLVLAHDPTRASDPAWVFILVLAAACLGFLVHNWPPARVFMGDVGSLYLGFAIFALAAATIAKGWLSYSTWAVLAAAFVADATVTLARRALRRVRLQEAHRSHAYQRLARRWRSHGRVAVTTLLIDIGWLLPLALVAQTAPSIEWLVVAIAYGPLLAGAIVVGAGLPDDA